MLLFLFFQCYLFALTYLHSNYYCFFLLKTGQLFDATLSQDVAFFDRVPTGDLVTRLAADTQMIQRAATVQVVAAMRSIIMGAGGTACLMYTSPSLAMVSLGTLPPILLAARYFGRVIKDKQRHVQELLSESTTVAEETFSNVRTVRQFTAEKHESRRYSDKVEQTYDKAVEAGMAQAWFDGTVHTAANASILGVLGYGGKEKYFLFFFFLCKCIFISLSLSLSPFHTRYNGIE
jgi:ATP-binding cassette subfamily B (MDR/TAP) protein 10